MFERKGMMFNMTKSDVFVAIVQFCIIWAVLSFGGGRSDASIASLWTYHILLVAELSPIAHPFLSASLPLLLG